MIGLLAKEERERERQRQRGNGFILGMGVR